MDSTSLLDQLSGYWSALDQHPILHAGLAFGLLLVGALILGRVARYIVLYAANLLARQPALHWLGDLIRNKVFQRLAQTTPSLLVQFGLPWIPEMPDKAAHFLGNLALAFTVLFLILALTALLNALLDIYARTEHARTRSIKGYVQLAKIAVFVFGAIIIVSIIIDRSPLLLLSGLGAMSAVLLLVYKDTLMSFVASVQLTSNDMLRVGDWIEMPQVGADGDVVDITLYTVKVQNFDKTIVSVPTWRLMSESFKNWRGMQQSGGRRIKRAIYVDSSQVRFLDEKEERRLSQVRLLTEYMARKQDRVAGVECRQRRGRPAGRQPPPADQHRYVPRLRPRLPAEPSGHPSAHDLHGPPVAADRPGHPAGDILLHPHHRLGRLRAHPGRRVRLPAGGDAGVRPRRLPATQRPGPAPGAAGHARRA